MGRQNNFDALRLAGALAVLVSHQFAVQGLPEPAIAGGFSLGYIAVCMFFAVSGYLVTGSWIADPEAYRFIARRALRMGPGWAVLMVLTILNFYLGGPAWFPDNPVNSFNGSLWTLEWEILCYAALGCCAVLMPIRIVLPIMFATLLVCMWVFDNGHGMQLGLMFCAGAMLKVYGPLVQRLPSAAWIAIATIFYVADMPFEALLIAIPVLSVRAGSAAWPAVRSAGRYGDLSYGIYIYAFPVQQFGVLWFGKDSPYLALLLYSSIVTMALAFASWHLIEAPALSFKGRLKAALNESIIQRPAATA